MLGEGPTYGITGGFSSQEKKIIINFSKARAKFCLTLHYNGDSSVNEKEIYKFKANDKNFNFPAQFCLRSISNGFAATKTREVSKDMSMNFQLIAILLTELAVKTLSSI